MRGGIGQRYEGGKYEIDTQKRKPRFTEPKKKLENIQCHVGVGSVDGDGGGEVDCPCPSEIHSQNSGMGGGASSAPQREVRRPF